MSAIPQNCWMDRARVSLAEMKRNWNRIAETKSNNRRQGPNIRGDLSKPPASRQYLALTWYALVQ